MEVVTEKNIAVKDSLFDPNSRNHRTVNYDKGSDTKIRYKVWIHLEGRDTYYVDYVVYRLHPTFRGPIKKVKRTITNPNCSLVIWTWGLFDIGVEIFLKTGEKIIATHYTSYDRQLRTEGLNFVEVEELDM